MNLKVIIGLCLFASATAAAQQQQSAATAPKRAPVCAEGVKMYADIKEIPVPHDTVQIPPGDGPIRVTNEEEARAAEQLLRKRAGSVGATGILATMVETDSGDGMVRMSRRVVGVYVRADSAVAQKNCSK